MNQLPEPAGAVPEHPAVLEAVPALHPLPPLHPAQALQGGLPQPLHPLLGVVNTGGYLRDHEGQELLTECCPGFEDVYEGLVRKSF